MSLGSGEVKACGRLWAGLRGGAPHADPRSLRAGNSAEPCLIWAREPVPQRGLKVAVGKRWW